MLNVNQKTMENYRVIKDTKNGRYYIVCAYHIELELIESGMFEILKTDDPTARQILDESFEALIIDWANLVCESEHYLYYSSFHKYFWDWEVLKK